MLQVNKSVCERNTGRPVASPCVLLWLLCILFFISYLHKFFSHKYFATPSHCFVENHGLMQNLNTIRQTYFTIIKAKTELSVSTTVTKTTMHQSSLHPRKKYYGKWSGATYMLYAGLYPTDSVSLVCGLFLCIEQLAKSKSQK